MNLKMTKEEKLEFENIVLRRQIAKTQYDAVLAAEAAKEDALVLRLNARLKVNMEEYSVNLVTGELSKKQPNPERK